MKTRLRTETPRDHRRLLLLNRPRAGGGSGPRSGAVIANDKYPQDALGRFRPLGLTCFPLVWGVRHDRDRFEKNLEWAADHAVHAPRILGEVGGTSWEDRVIDPRLATYEQDLGDALDLNWAYGMRTILSIFGGGCISRDHQSDVDLTVQKVLNVVRSRLDRVLCLEVANEDNFPGSGEDLKRVARTIRTALPSVLLAPCSLDLETTEQFCSPSMCNVQNLHQDRTPGDYNWRQARQLWDVPQYDFPMAALEPMGVDLCQNQDLNDPVRLGFCWAVGLFRSFQIWVLHSGPGVRLGGQYDLNMGRAANFYDIDADLAPAAAGLLAMERLLPLDVAYWTKTSQRGRDPWNDQFLYADAIFSDEGEDHGVSRNYTAYNPGGPEFVTLSYGVKQHADLIARANLNATVYDLRSGVSEDVSIPNGGRYRLMGNATADYGYVVVGTRS